MNALIVSLCMAASPGDCLQVEFEAGPSCFAAFIDEVPMWIGDNPGYEVKRWRCEPREARK